VLASLPALVRYLRTEKPGAMLSAQPHCNLTAIWARMICGAHMRLVISEHNTRMNASGHAHPLKEKMIPVLMRRFYRKADAIVTVSGGVADEVARITGLPRGEFHVIYNPIVFPELDTLATAPVDHPWFGADQAPVILSAGRLTTQKDHATLLEAFALLRQRRPAHLVILGDGEKRPALAAQAQQAGISEFVSMPGFTGNPFAFMARCKVFVLSSRWEGFGNVLVEAMACGAQVVSTDCPSGPAEILENGRYGQLVPAGDPVAMAAAIETALDDPLPVERVRARAGDFSIRNATLKYLQHLTGDSHA
jgi:glycosyltransferase involved in cell wall biosynthesis